MNLHASRAVRALAPFALPALLCGALGASATAQLPVAAVSARQADLHRSSFSTKPALMAWNRKRAFPVVDREGRRLGELTDFVLDRTTGRLTHTALVVEELGAPVATKAFPVRDLRWDADAQHFRSQLARGSIAALPEFSAVWLERLEEGTRQIVEAGHDPRADLEPVAPRFLLAGDVEGSPLVAADGRVGIGLGVILDMNPGEVAYFLLGADEEHRQGDLYPVPWPALRVFPDGRFGVDKTAREMAAAPAIPKELIASLTMAGFRMEVAAFYGVPSRIDQRLQCLANEGGS